MKPEIFSTCLQIKSEQSAGLKTSCELSPCLIASSFDQCSNVHMIYVLTYTEFKDIFHGYRPQR